MYKLGIAAIVIALGLAGEAANARGHSYHYSYRPHSYSYHHSYYTNVSGHRVHTPIYSSHRPSGASAQCADGSWSFSEHARGTCSHHGGVAHW